MRKVVVLLRWVYSIGFFFLALTKTKLLFVFGLEPYKVIIETLGLPMYFSYYGVLAILVEVYLAVGLWDNKYFKTAIIFAGLLTGVGIIISASFILFKINSDCGCGLLGGSEYGFLAQKLVIIIGLLVLYNNRARLFVEE